MTDGKLLCCILLFSSVPATSQKVAEADRLKGTAIPKYLVYRHFLAMVDGFNGKAMASPGGGQYQFATAFNLAGWANPELDLMRNEAKSLTNELHQIDNKAQAARENYRKTARAQVLHDKPLPPPPPEIYRLQSLRNAVMVRHVVSLQSKLGPAKATRLENYLAYAFTPN